MARSPDNPVFVTDINVSFTDNAVVERVDSQNSYVRPAGIHIDVCLVSAQTQVTIQQLTEALTEAFGEKGWFAEGEAAAEQPEQVPSAGPSKRGKRLLIFPTSEEGGQEE